MVAPAIPALGVRVLAEVVGTFLLIFFGCGAVHTAVLLDAQSGLWQVAIVWAVAITLAIFTVGGISGAHINPAMTIALAVYGRASWRIVLPYIAGQLAGAVLAAATLFMLFQPYLELREHQRGVQRGSEGSIVTAMCYCEYFPNPGGISKNTKLKTATDVEAAWLAAQGRFSHAAAFFAELLGTAILAFAVFALTDPRNAASPGARLAPVFIGLTVGLLISVLDPLTQACFNPARDFGPRLFAYCAGWGEAALPGPRAPGFLTVYILAPIGGAILGGGLYTQLFAPRQPSAV